MQGTTIVEWQTPDHELPVKPADWYISVVVMGVSVSIASIFLGNIMFAIFSILAAASIIIHAAKKPEMIDIIITTQGVQIRHDFYPYAKLHSFWVVQEKNRNEIILQSDRAVLPHLIVPIKDVNPEFVRNELRKHIPERYVHKNLFDIALEYLGF